MNEEQKRVLEMLQDGKVSADQAEKLLDALATGVQPEVAAPPGNASYIGMSKDDLASMVATLRDLAHHWREQGKDERAARWEQRAQELDEKAALWEERAARMDERAEGWDRKAATADAPLGGIAQMVQQAVAAAMRGFHGALGSAAGTADEGQSRRESYSPITLTTGYLSRLPDNTVFTNYGPAHIAPDVPVELLAQKIAEYHNYGPTDGPPELIAVLMERCPANFGPFSETGEGERSSGGVRTVQNHGEMTLSRHYLENLDDGSNFENYGEVTIAADVPAELLRQKVAEYVNHGETTGTPELLGVLQSRCSENHGEFHEAGEGGAGKRSNLGQLTITREYLEQMEDGSTFENLGQLTVAREVPPELLTRKIGRMTNLGQVNAPAPLLAALQSRCVSNLGVFRESDAA